MTAVGFGRPTNLRFTRANRDAMKYSSRAAATQRLVSGATASWAAREDSSMPDALHVILRGAVVSEGADALLTAVQRSDHWHSAKVDPFRLLCHSRHAAPNLMPGAAAAYEPPVPRHCDRGAEGA